MSTTAETAFDRDSFASLYAKRHLETDSGVVRIFYLPTNAPSREIRLLEVNHMISETTPLAPIDFGVGVSDSERHTLYVLDVTPSQWDAIQQQEIPLPTGWILDGKQELAAR